MFLNVYMAYPIVAILIMRLFSFVLNLLWLLVAKNFVRRISYAVINCVCDICRNEIFII